MLTRDEREERRAQAAMRRAALARAVAMIRAGVRNTQALADSLEIAGGCGPLVRELRRPAGAATRPIEATGRAKPDAAVWGDAAAVIVAGGGR